MIQVKKTTIASADILTLNATPIEILAAPASGKVRNILGVSMELIFNTTAYALGLGSQLQVNTSPNVTVWGTNTQTLASVGNRNSAFQIGVNCPLTISSAYNLKLNAAAAPTLGDSDIDIYVIFEEKDAI